MVKTPEEEERLSATVTAVVADHCYTSPATSSRLSATSTTSSIPTTSNQHKSTTGGGNHCHANQTPKQSTRRVNSRSAELFIVLRKIVYHYHSSCHPSFLLLDDSCNLGSPSVTSLSSSSTGTSPTAVFLGRAHTPWGWRYCFAKKQSHRTSEFEDISQLYHQLVLGETQPL